MINSKKVSQERLIEDRVQAIEVAVTEILGMLIVKEKQALIQPKGTKLSTKTTMQISAEESLEKLLLKMEGSL